MSECIFCQIIEGRVPCAKIYEDEFAIGFLDISPINPGHALVVPKAHFETILDIPADLLKACAVASQKIAGAVLKGSGAPGLNLLQNNFKAGGQHVGHIHFHIIPRIPGDGFLYWPEKSHPQVELENVAKKIKAECEKLK